MSKKTNVDVANEINKLREKLVRLEERFIGIVPL